MAGWGARAHRVKASISIEPFTFVCYRFFFAGVFIVAIVVSLVVWTGGLIPSYSGDFFSIHFSCSKRTKNKK